MRLSVALPSLLAVLLMALPASAARKKPHPVPPPSTPIACSRGYCHPVPAGCHPEPGFLPDGMPSGYDVVVCPGYH
jgi:hypothetical protein